MAKLTILVGAVLIVLGLVAYFGLSGDTKSATALIPAFFGVPMAILGLVALRPGARKHAMHGAAALGLLGILGTVTAYGDVPALLSDASQLERPAASAVRAIMATVCIGFVGAAVASFVAARGGAKSSA